MMGMPTMMEVTLRAAPLYLAGMRPSLISRWMAALSRASGVGGFGRGAAGLEGFNGFAGSGIVVACFGGVWGFAGVGRRVEDGVEGDGLCVCVGIGAGRGGSGSGCVDADDGDDTVFGGTCDVSGAAAEGSMAMGCSMTTLAAPPVGSTTSSTGGSEAGGFSVPVL